MTEKRFQEKLTGQRTKRQRIATIVSNTLLFLGTFVIVSAIIYLMVNLDKSDSLVIMLIPVFVGGLGFIIISQVIKRPGRKLRR
jgi:uncharacterized membrane-anchored protein